MNRAVLGVILGFAALAIAVPLLVIQVLLPMRAESTGGMVNNNQVPSDLQALTLHDRLAIQLAWTPVNQGTATYVLQRSEGGAKPGWVDLTELAPGVNSYLDDVNLQDGVTYLYRIYAWDSRGGSGYSGVAGAVASALPQPTPLDQAGLDQLQAQLDANIQKWYQGGVSDYAVEFSVTCFCPISVTAPVSVKVLDNDTIQAITYVDSGEPVTENLELYLTVGGMFNLIQEAIDTRVARLTVSYDPQLGYPTSVFIDRDFLMADEEKGFTVTSFEPIAPPTLEEIQSSLDSGRGLWESKGMSSYQIEYRRICFCAPNITSPVIVVVRDGSIVSRTYAETGEPVGEAVRDFFPDVPGIFDLVQDAIDQQADLVRVNYDSVYGYPTGVRIDYEALMADEEIEFEVISFN